MATETIKITRDGIRESRMQQGTPEYDMFCDCPIGQAVAEAHPEWDFRIFRTYIAVFEGDAHRQIPLPTEATEFIEAFDDGLPVEPIEFEIEVRGRD